MNNIGRVVKGVGGMFDVQPTDGGARLSCRARGNLRRGEEKILVGDLVRVDTEPGGTVISEVMPRKNALIRPPLSNIDRLYAVLAVREPAPIYETTDKLLCIAEHNGIAVTVVITKTDIVAPDETGEIYRKAGYEVFSLSSVTGEGVSSLREAMRRDLAGGGIAAFAGASGVGKSSLLNALFPALSLQTGEISRKIGRGKNTTRHTELYPVFGEGGGFLADTAGFSMLDFVRFDFMGTEDLFGTFREFAPYAADCRFADCRHVKEEECGVRRAVAEGKIAPSRYESYVALDAVLRRKNPFGGEK